MSAKSTLLATAATLVVLLVAGSARLYSLVNIAGDRWPAKDRAVSLSHEIAALRQKVDKAAVPEADTILARYIAPDDDSLELVAESIQNLALATEVEIQSLGFIGQADGKIAWSEQPGRAVKELPLAIRLVGGFDNIALFINRLESVGDDETGRLFAVESVAITSGEGARHSAAIEAKTFCFNPQAGQFLRMDREIELAALAAAQKYLYTSYGRDPMTAPIWFVQKRREEAVQQPPPSPTPEKVSPEPPSPLRESTSQPVLTVEKSVGAVEETIEKNASSAPETKEETAPRAEAKTETPASPEPEPKTEVVIVPEAEPSRAVPATQPKEQAPTEEEFSRLALEVNGIAWSPEEPRAFVNGMPVGVGDTVAATEKEPLKIVDIFSDQVRFLYRGRIFSKRVELFSPRK